MNYFKDCKTLDQAKTLFRKLSHKLHPDKGGTHADFIELMKQFKSFRPNINKDSDKGFDHDKFYNLIKLFDGLEGLRISFVGSFIWIEDVEAVTNYKDAATYKQKDLLKAIKIDGLNPVRYASKKNAWYFSPVDYKQKSKSKKSLDQLKNQWGCKSFNSVGLEKLTN